MLNVVRNTGEHQCSVASRGVGVGPLVCSAVGNLIAYAEDALQPRIFIIKYPSFELVSTLEGNIFYFLCVCVCIILCIRWCGDAVQLSCFFI